MSAAIKSGPPAIAASHPTVWERMPFTLQYGWLNVGELLKAPGGGAGTFVLEPFDEPDIVGDRITRLRVRFNGTLNPHWANTVFDTCGTRVPRLASNLPEWDGTADTAKIYRNTLRSVIDLLKQNRCDLQRIEGRFERIEKFPDDVARSVYVFRGVYLAGAVTSSSGANTDLVLFIANDSLGGPAPDGGATGPPKPP